MTACPEVASWCKQLPEPQPSHLCSGSRKEEMLFPGGSATYKKLSPKFCPTLVLTWAGRVRERHPAARKTWECGPGRVSSLILTSKGPSSLGWGTLRHKSAPQLQGARTVPAKDTEPAPAPPCGTWADPHGLSLTDPRPHPLQLQVPSRVHRLGQTSGLARSPSRHPGLVSPQLCSLAPLQSAQDTGPLSGHTAQPV